MINIEQEIFKLISTAVKAQFSNVVLLGEYTVKPPSFPCVFVTEIENTTFGRTQTSDDMENHITVGYQIDIYTDSTTKKKDAKNIAEVVDNTMLGLKFNRSYMESQSEDVGKIYRLTIRYDAVIDKDYRIYSQ